MRKALFMRPGCFALKAVRFFEKRKTAPFHPRSGCCDRRKTEDLGLIAVSPARVGAFSRAIMHVTIEAAEAAIQAARKRAVELGTEMCIAIVDSEPTSKRSIAWTPHGPAVLISRSRKQKPPSFSGCLLARSASCPNREVPSLAENSGDTMCAAEARKEVRVELSAVL